MGFREQRNIAYHTFFYLFDMEHYKKIECVHRNHDAQDHESTALFREKCSFKRILIIFLCKCLHSNDHLHTCF